MCALAQASLVERLERAQEQGQPGPSAPGRGRRGWLPDELRPLASQVLDDARGIIAVEAGGGGGAAAALA